MERSQLPLLRKKKGPKDAAAKEKREFSVKDKPCEGKVSPFKNPATGLKNHLRESSPNDDKTLKREPRPATDLDCENVVAKDSPRKATTPVDLEWSKYMVKGGSPSDNYQKFNPEKSPGAGKNPKCGSAGLVPHRSHLPHQVGLSSTKFTSADGYSPSAVQKELRIYGGSPGHSTAPSVFTFDPKHLYDPDSSPIYHELDPIEGNRQPINHTYQSITEIREEVERLHTGNGSSAGQSQQHPQSSGTLSRSPVRSNSGPVLLCSSVQNGCSSPRRRPNQSNAASTLPPSKPSAPPPKSPLHGPSSTPSQSLTPVGPPQIATTPSRAQSIFSKLWLQKKSALAKAAATSVPSPTRNRSLDAISVEVPKTPKNRPNKTYSTLYAVTSPPPITASVFANYYQNFDPGQGDDDPAVHRPTLDHFDYYGLPSERILRGFSGPSKRSFSDSTAAGQTPVSKGKTSVENRLPWRTCRDLSPGRSCVDRWDVVRFGEPLESHISGGGEVSLETFKGSCSGGNKSSLKQNKVPSSPGRHQAVKGPSSQTPVTSLLKKEFASVKGKANRVCGRTVRPAEEARDTERLGNKTKPKSYLHRTQLSRSQENVLSGFSLEFLQSPPGSFESLLSEDDVFLPGSSERLNLLLSPPSSRTTFSSPSCGIRMAELRAGRRRSDSKSPSPEPPSAAAGASTPPPFPPLFQIPPPFCRGVETVIKQDVAVQTSPTKSPVRIGGLSPHRYMHTIIEEDHPDQVSNTDGKAIIAEHTGRAVVVVAVPTGKSTRSEREIDTIRTSGATGVRCKTDDLLGAISTDDDDGDDDDDEEEEEDEDNADSGEIKLSHTSAYSAGSDRLGTGDPRAEDDPPPPLPSPASPLAPKESIAAEGGMKASPPLDPRGPEGESSPRSVGETGSAVGRSSKTSRLRPPKPAKFFARAGNQGVEEASSLSARCSPVGPQSRVARIGELPVQSPLKQLNEASPASAATKTQSPSAVKRGTSSPAKPVEISVGSGDHLPVSTSETPVSAAPQGPLRGCRNGATQQPGGAGQKNVSQLKPLCDPSAPDGQEGGPRPGRTGTHRRQLSAEHSDSSPVSCSRNTTGSYNFPSTAARHSSLSSSLTSSSSSSSSVFSLPDSESEGTTLTRPSRKDAQEKSRLALPRINVSRSSRDKPVTGTSSQHEIISVKQESALTNDNNDDETTKLSSSSSSSSSSELPSTPK